MLASACFSSSDYAYEKACHKSRKAATLPHKIFPVHRNIGISDRVEAPQFVDFYSSLKESMLVVAHPRLQITYDALESRLKAP